MKDTTYFVRMLDVGPVVYLAESSLNDFINIPHIIGTAYVGEYEPCIAYTETTSYFD